VPARRHVEQAAQRGQPAVAAVVALDRMVEASRAGRYAPVDGPVTIDDDIRALVDHIVEVTLLRAFAAVEARAGEVGWEAAVGEYRRKHPDSAEFVAGQRDAGSMAANRAAAAEVSAWGRRWVGVDPRGGRPPVDGRVQAAIYGLAVEHPDWGSRRIAREAGASRRSAQRWLAAEGRAGVVLRGTAAVRTRPIGRRLG
jgi:hypothetical protein